MKGSRSGLAALIKWQLNEFEELSQPKRINGNRLDFDRLYCSYFLFFDHDSAGKVHGSLARAGKVRGQTPKVAPQEKAKKPKGRASQRLKYNRRFVNVGK